MSTFISNDWKFGNDNVLSLWSTLSQDDREQFWFSFDDFDWKTYDKLIVCSIKKYILRENESDLKKALAKNRK